MAASAQSSSGVTEMTVEELEAFLEKRKKELETVIANRESMLQKQADIRQQLKEQQDAATGTNAAPHLPRPASPLANFGQAGRMVHDQCQQSFALPDTDWIDHQKLSIARGNLHSADPLTNGQILSVGTVPPS